MLDATFLNNATRTQIEPAMQNQVYNEVVGFSKLKAKSRTKVHTGTGITFNTVLKKHEAVGLLPAYEALATQQINPTVQGTLSPALYYAVVGVSEREVTLNTGGDQVKEFDMVTVQVDNARATLQDVIGSDFYGVGTANPDGYLPLTGLDAIIGSTIYAGISSATYAQWKAYQDTTTHTLTKLQDPADAEYMPNVMYSAYFGTSFEQTIGDILLSIGLYQLYMNIAGDKLRLSSSPADLTFGGATFAGGIVTMSFDRHVPDGTSGASYGRMYFLNFKRFMLLNFPGKDFNMQDPGWLKTVSPAAQMARFEWAGQMYCEVRREQGLVKDCQYK